VARQESSLLSAPNCLPIGARARAHWLPSGVLLGGLIRTSHAKPPPFEDDPHAVGLALQRLVDWTGAVLYGAWRPFGSNRSPTSCTSPYGKEKDDECTINKQQTTPSTRTDYQTVGGIVVPVTRRLRRGRRAPQDRRPMRHGQLQPLTRRIGRSWDAVIDRIDGRARCIAVDQRGWGASIATDGRYDLAAMADDVQALMVLAGSPLTEDSREQVIEDSASLCPPSLGPGSSLTTDVDPLSSHSPSRSSAGPGGSSREDGDAGWAVCLGSDGVLDASLAEFG